MTDLEILSKFVDRREFRNYIYYKLYKMGYTAIKIDDERISDEHKVNDNDIILFKDNIMCTVQTFLNKEISEEDVEETEEDMEYEHVTKGIIITNKNVSKDIKKVASDKNIEIYGEEFFRM